MNLQPARAAAEPAMPPSSHAPEPAPRWLAAVRAALGPNIPAHCFTGMDAAGVECHAAPGGPLVLLDRNPMCGARFRSPLNLPPGAAMELVGEVEDLGHAVLHGRYRGRLGGTAVVMDQYVRMRNCVPQAIARVIAPGDAAAPDRAAVPGILLDGRR